jgi:hypothetical protein
MRIWTGTILASFLVAFTGYANPIVAHDTSVGETRIAADGHVPPPASIADMTWLEGQWAGPRH